MLRSAPNVAMKPVRPEHSVTPRHGTLFLFMACGWLDGDSFDNGDGGYAGDNVAV